MTSASTTPLTSANQSRPAPPPADSGETPGMHEPTPDDIVSAVRDYLAQWRPAFLPATTLASDQNLLEFLDSFAFIELLLHLEKTFRIPIHTADIELSEIIALDRLVAYVLFCAKASSAPERR
jgi:acyl carrier protein